MLSGAGVALEAFQVGAHFRGALVAEVAVLFHGLVDELFELGRSARIEADGGDWRLVENLVEDCAGTFAFERKKTGSHFVEQDAEGKKIGASVELLAKDLLR